MALWAWAPQPVIGSELQAQDSTVLAVPDPGASLSVHLLTAEPGDMIWEVFGHNGLLIRDSDTGFERVYHYGLFSFGPGFLPRFMKGDMMYLVGGTDLPPFLRIYQQQNRKVWAQELNLSSTQKARLYVFLETAIRPENREYRYQYFENNCSTKLRDAINLMVGDQVREATEPDSGSATWRTHTARLTEPFPPGYLGIQLLLGPKGDESTTAWDELWVPMKLRDTLAGLTVLNEAGEVVPLVLSEELLNDSTRPAEAVAPPRPFWMFLIAGIGFGALVMHGARSAGAGSRLGKAGSVLTMGGWSLVCFLIGAILVAVHWTDHEFMYWNQNVLLFSPLGLALAFLLPRSAMRIGGGPWTKRLASASFGLALLAVLLWLLPWTRQGNGELILFALPVHAAIWWAVTRTLGRVPAGGFGGVLTGSPPGGAAGGPGVAALP